MNKVLKGLLPGIIVIAVLSIISYQISQINVIKGLGISSLVVGIVLGIIFAHTLRPFMPSITSIGITFSAKKILRLGIILFGFNITFAMIVSVGIVGFLAALIMVLTTFIAGCCIGQKWLNLDRDTSILIASGSAVCGAAAVLAAEGTLKSESYKTAVAVGTVVMFGTLSMFLYPLLMHANLLPLDNNSYGVFIGSSVHEVAQVVAAGNAVSQHSEEVGVIVKMIRVIMLAPLLIGVSLWLSKKYSSSNDANEKVKIIIPWFAVLFIIVAIFNSFHFIPKNTVHYILIIDTFLLTMAMTALGAETHISKFKNVGFKPIFLAIILFAWLFIGGVFVSYLLCLI